MNRVMVGAVDEFFDRFLTSTLSYLGLKTTPRGGFVLEKFFIKKKVGPKTPILNVDFQKMQEDFFRKQNHRGSARQIFFTLVVEKPLKKCSTYMPLYLPLRQKEANSGKVVKANHVCDLL